jgi:hypothetical protein
MGKDEETEIGVGRSSFKPTPYAVNVYKIT